MEYRFTIPEAIIHPQISLHHSGTQTRATLVPEQSPIVSFLQACMKGMTSWEDVAKPIRLLDQKFPQK